MAEAAQDVARDGLAPDRLRTAPRRRTVVAGAAVLAGLQLAFGWPGPLWPSRPAEGVTEAGAVRLAPALVVPAPETVAIAAMTWPEVAAALAAGSRTVLVPTGGLEQNGPHMAIGKHDLIVASAAAAIARRLGRTLVAPVVSFVPEGRHYPPTGHLRFPGTIGVTEEAFAATLDGIARSLKGSGFRLVAFLADHGGSVPVQGAVAERLSREWAAEGVRVVSVDSYYEDPRVAARLAAEGESAATIGLHGGIQDTSELLAVAPGAVRTERLPGPAQPSDETGTNGDAARASAARGRAYLDLRIDAAVTALTALRDASPTVQASR